MEAVAHAAPDGYTLGFANTGNITINPFLFAHMPFDPLSDLVPGRPIGTVPLFLVINGRCRREDAGGIHRLCQGQSGHRQLCGRGRRHHAGPGRLTNSSGAPGSSW